LVFFVVAFVAGDKKEDEKKKIAKVGKEDISKESIAALSSATPSPLEGVWYTVACSDAAINPSTHAIKEVFPSRLFANKCPCVVSHIESIPFTGKEKTVVTEVKVKEKEKESGEGVADVNKKNEDEEAAKKKEGPVVIQTTSGGEGEEEKKKNESMRVTYSCQANPKDVFNALLAPVSDRIDGMFKLTFPNIESKTKGKNVGKPEEEANYFILNFLAGRRPEDASFLASLRTKDAVCIKSRSPTVDRSILDPLFDYAKDKGFAELHMMHCRAAEKTKTKIEAKTA